MPVLSNPRHEKFARLIANGETQSDAYRACFNVVKSKAKTIHECASKLRAEPKVSTRIVEMQERSAKKADITVDKLNQMLLSAKARARKLGKPEAEVSAVKVLAQINGHMVDPRKNNRAPLEDATDAEIEQAIARLSGVAKEKLPAVRH